MHRKFNPYFKLLYITGLFLLSGCAATSQLPGALTLMVLLSLGAACRPLLDEDRMDEFLLRYLMNTKSSSSSLGCTGTQDYSQSFDLSSVDPAAVGIGFKITSEATGDGLGQSVAGAGDFNGDGIGDFIVGAGYYNSNQGRAYLIFGRRGSGGDIALGSLSTTEGVSIAPALASGQLGNIDNFSAAGDVNGDGFDDILLGARYANGSRGHVYLIFGTATPSNLDLSSLTAARGVQYEGVAGADGLGWAVAATGDVNGDGIDDFALGQSLGAVANQGEVNVVFGRTSGWSTPVTTSAITGSEGFTVAGKASNDYVSGIARVRDLNGDGLNEIIFGAYLANSNAGAGYVIYGTAGTRSDININSGLSATDGYEITGGGTYQMGRAVAGEGDFNGDGQTDLVLSSRSYNSNAGRTAVLFGDTGALTLGSLNPGQGFTLDGTSSEQAGRSLSMSGDVNGDGLHDLLIGAQNASHSGGNSGSAYLIFGQSNIANAGAALATYADGVQGIRIDGTAGTNRLGSSVDLSDVNGDGCADLLVGSPGNSGSTYAHVIFGGKAR